MHYHWLHRSNDRRNATGANLWRGRKGCNFVYEFSLQVYRREPGIPLTGDQE
jgi:hypothetical protein